mgnify:CR=1 FL=1
MDKNKKFASNGFAFSGALMFIAGILMMVSGRVAIGAVFWALANCMFLAARYFAKAAEGKDAETK